jgi:di/tricarboxylate transporter
MWLSSNVATITALVPATIAAAPASTRQTGRSGVMGRNARREAGRSTVFMVISTARLGNHI